jgi:hypothetical protein
MYYGSQFAWDNACEPERDDRLDERVYEELENDFDDGYWLEQGFSNEFADLLLKVCKKTASLDDFIEFKKEAANWYETELERYGEKNFDKKEKEIIEHHNSI